MIILGKYDEFGPGMGFPSVKEFLNDGPYDTKQAILDHLNKGKVHMVTASRFKDIFTGEDTGIEMVFMDDGEYSWTSKLIYYVDKYNLRLPATFEQHVLS